MAENEEHGNSTPQYAQQGGASLEQPQGVGRAVSRQPVTAEGKEFKQTLRPEGAVPVDDLIAAQQRQPTSSAVELSGVLYADETPTRRIDSPAESGALIPYKIYGQSRDANAVTTFSEELRNLPNEQYGTGYTFDHPGKPVHDHIVDHRSHGGQGLADGSPGGRPSLGQDIYTRDERRRYTSGDPQEP